MVSPTLEQLRDLLALVQVPEQRDGCCAFHVISALG